MEARRTGPQVQLGPVQLGMDPGGKALTPLMIRALWAAASLAISIRIKGKKKNAVTLIHLQGGDS